MLQAMNEKSLIAKNGSEATTPLNHLNPIMIISNLEATTSPDQIEQKHKSKNTSTRTDSLCGTNTNLYTIYNKSCENTTNVIKPSKVCKSLTHIITYAHKDEVPVSDGTLFTKDHYYDINVDPSKRYFRMDYIDFQQRLLRTPIEQRTFYEYIEGKNRKIYADIEYEFSDADREAAIDNFDQVLGFVLFGIKTELESKSVPYSYERDCIILQSHGANKRSVHIIINNWFFDKCNIKATSNVFAFMTAVRNYIPTKLWHFTKPSETKRSETLDMSVYSSGKEFRLIWNTKIGKNRYLDVDPCTGLQARFPTGTNDIDVEQLRLFEGCLVTMTYNWKSLPDWYIESDSKHSVIKNMVDITSEQRDKMIQAFNNSEFHDIYRLDEHQSTSKNAIYMVPINKSVLCPIHNRCHKSNHAKLCYSAAGNIYVSCYGQGANNIRFIGKDVIPEEIDEDLEDNPVNDDNCGLNCGDFILKPGENIEDAILKQQVQKRAPAYPIIGSLNTNVDPITHSQGTLTSGKVVNISKAALREYNNDRTTFPEVREGQMLIPCATTTIASFINGNTIYIGGNEYQVHEVFNSYERYRCGQGVKYNFANGDFGKALRALGHFTEQKTIKREKIYIVTLKRADPITNTNPLEAINAMLTNLALEPVQGAKQRQLDKNNDIKRFIDEYLIPDINSSVDIENLFLCFKDYCGTNKIILNRFGQGRFSKALQMFVVLSGKIIKGYRCKEDKLDLANQSKEERYRRIWEWNTAPYQIGWHNGKSSARYEKTYSIAWRDIDVKYCNDEHVKSINELIELTPGFDQILDARTKDIRTELKDRRMRRLITNFQEETSVLEQSIMEDVNNARENAQWCIASRSTFATGKTYNLRPYIESYPTMKVLIVLPRITLTDEYTSYYRQHGFVPYTDSNDNGEIRGNRMIICYPSSYRIRGEFDLVVLDEYKVIKDLQHTLVRKNDKEKRCFEALTNYVRDTPRVYVADALLTNAHVLEISRMRQGPMIVYQNFYQKHKGNIVFTVENKHLMLHLILSRLRRGERVAVPTNVKAFADFIEKKVLRELPDIQYSKVTADNKATIPLQELWHGKQLVVYTPTILAGNSYTDPIDVVFGFFTPMSCDQADDMQMLMRCRNVTSKQYYISIDPKPAKKLIPDDIPATFKDIKQYYLRRDVIVRMQSAPDIPEEFRLPMDMLRFNPSNETFVADDLYFDSYVNFIKQNVIKQREYEFRMLLYMRDCGFSYGGNIYIQAKDRQAVDQISDEHKEFNKEKRELELDSISNANNILTDEYHKLSKKRIKTKSDIYEMRKYRLRNHYKIDNVPKWFIKATKGKHQQYSNLLRFEQMNGITDPIEKNELMTTIGNEMLKLKDTPQEDPDIIEHIKETNIALDVNTCFHALNILGIIGVHEFIRSQRHFHGLKTEDCLPILTRYLIYHKEQIELILKNKVEDHIKDCSKITTKAFGITIQDSGGAIAISNMWIRYPNDMIWPINLILYDDEELRLLPSYQEQKHDIWLNQDVPKYMAWTDSCRKKFIKVKSQVPTLPAIFPAKTMTTTLIGLKAAVPKVSSTIKTRPIKQSNDLLNLKAKAPVFNQIIAVH